MSFINTHWEPEQTAVHPVKHTFGWEVWRETRDVGRPEEAQLPFVDNKTGVNFSYSKREELMKQYNAFHSTNSCLCTLYIQTHYIYVYIRKHYNLFMHYTSLYACTIHTCICSFFIGTCTMVHGLWLNKHLILL